MVVWHIKGVGSNLKVIINTSGNLVGLFTVGYPLLLRDVSNTEVNFSSWLSYTRQARKLAADR